MARTADRRSTSNSYARGSSYQRRARKQWLLDTFGDGITAPCRWCQTPVTLETISVDRVTPGCEGGTYARPNIEPACLPCNVSHGGKLGAARREANRTERSSSCPGATD